VEVEVSPNIYELLGFSSAAWRRRPVYSGRLSKKKECFAGFFEQDDLGFGIFEGGGAMLVGFEVVEIRNTSFPIHHV